MPALLVVVLCWLLAGCNLPRDPNGTTERVRNGALRVGITEQPPWTMRAEPEPQGLEAEIVKRFAAELGAKVVWVWGSEQRLLENLARYELDLVVGGLTDDTPWKKRVGLTVPYVEHERRVYEAGEPTTQTERHVIAVQPGENRFLVKLERFLRKRESEWKSRLKGAT